MKVPRLRGKIARRLLVNFRVEPDVIKKMLPAPFEPKLQNGYAVAGICDKLEGSKLFGSLEEASNFFKYGSLGYSETHEGNRLDGLQLETEQWCVEPFHADVARSSFFSDEAMFPKGSAVYDCALVMRNIEHSWQAAKDLQKCPTNSR